MPVRYAKLGTLSLFEDAKVEPTHAYYNFLKGRVLSGSSTQDFEVGWIFQRYVLNIPLSWFSRWFLEGHPWYETAVEAGRIETVMPAQLVVVFAAMLSPLLFPFVFACAFVALVPLGFLSVPHLRSYTTSDGNTVRKPKYSWSSIVQTAMSSGWYLLISVAPWIYFYYGPYDCVADVACRGATFHISPLLLVQMFACCMLAGFRFASAVSTSACDCACERQNQALFQNARYGDALKKIITKLSDMTDKRSYYPIFVYGESTEIADMPLPIMRHLQLIFLAAVHALLPHIWMMFRYNQPFISWEVDHATFTIMLLGTIAPFLEVRHFLKQFYMVNEEFEDVIDELLICIFIVSPVNGKQRTLLKMKYRQAVKRNDVWRQSNAETIRKKAGFEHFACMDTPTRFEDELLEYDDSYDLSTESPNLEGFELMIRVKGEASIELQKTELQKTTNELQDLHQVQVALNFKTIEGVRLFRHMRRWMNTDILNERLEVEHFVTISLILLVCGLVALLAAYLNQRSITAIWLLIPWDIFVLSLYIYRGLSLCIQANEFLFDESERILLEWQEHCALWNTDDPETLFVGPEGALAWIWKEGEVEQEGEVVPVMPVEALGTSRAKDVYNLLGVMVKRCKVLEQKQRILGLEVTKALRTRLLAAAGSALVAFSLKAPYLNQHFVSINLTS